MEYRVPPGVEEYTSGIWMGSVMTIFLVMGRAWLMAWRAVGEADMLTDWFGLGTFRCCCSCKLVRYGFHKFYCLHKLRCFALLFLSALFVAIDCYWLCSWLLTVGCSLGDCWLNSVSGCYLYRRLSAAAGLCACSLSHSLARLMLFVFICEYFLRSLWQTGRWAVVLVALALF